MAHVSPAIPAPMMTTFNLLVSIMTISLNFLKGQDGNQFPSYVVARSSYFTPPTSRFPGGLIPAGRSPVVLMVKVWEAFGDWCP